MGNDEYEEAANRARLDIDESQRNLLNIHIDHIKESYEVLSSNERSFILQGLDRLIQGIGDKKLMKRLKLGSFNPSEARKIRKDAGLTQTKLAEQIGLMKRGDAEIRGNTEISFYERGDREPLNGEFAIKYLDWLRDHGYSG
ncbi:MAG: helix-turn-helix transcriptional regulator [Candidatus Woesearchaeota archaeon]